MAGRVAPYVDNTGLVFAYDLANIARSYLGEPTVNLLYSAGAYNLIDGATDIYGRVTKTNLGGGKYRFVNNGTGVSTIRLYTNQSDLINGATYGCSVYFENLVGSLAIDWCDTSITGVNSSTSPSGRLYGTGTRALYDGPYYFLDVDLSTGGAVTLYDPQVEYKSHVTPFVAGTRSATQGLKDLTGNSTIDLSNVSFDSNAQMTFDGTDDYVRITRPVEDDFTLEVIFKTSTAAPTGTQWYQGVGLMDSEIGGYQNDFGLAYLNNKAVFGIGSTDTTIQSTSTINDGSYYHIVATRIRSTGAIAVYVNGILEATGTGNTNSLTSQTYMWIGSSNGGVGSNGAPNGDIPIAKAYNRALTADEIRTNYVHYKGRYQI